MALKLHAYDFIVREFLPILASLKKGLLPGIVV